MTARPWLHPFLDALKRTGIVSRACEAAGVGYGTVSNLRKTDADFAAAFDDAMEQAVDTAEAEAWRRAVQGYEEPVVYQGQLTPVWERDELGHVIEDTVIRVVTNEKGEREERAFQVPRQALDEQGRPKFLTVRKHSDALLQFILKGHRKRFATDRTEITGAEGGPVQVDESSRAMRVQQLLALAEQRKKAEEQFSDLA